MASLHVRLHVVVVFLIWLEGCIPAWSFSTSNTFAIIQGSNRAEDHSSLFAISPKNKKLATSRTEFIDASLRASALLKEEQVTSSSQGKEVTMFEKGWIPLNHTFTDADADAFNTEMNLLSQVLEYETLLEQTQDQSYMEGARDTLLEPHTTTTWDEKVTLSSATKPVQIYEGSASYTSTTSFEQIDESKNAVTGLSDVWTARILLIISAALYGTNFTVVKLLNDCVPTDVGAVLRFAMAAGVTLPWLFNPSNEKKIVNGELEGTGGEFSSRTFHHLPIEKSMKRLANVSFVDTPIFAGLEVGMWTGIGYLA